MIDLTTIDSIEHASPTNLLNNLVINHDRVKEVNNQIKSQYIDFNNLGVDLLENTPDIEKVIILEEMLQFINENYTNLPNLDLILSSQLKLLEIGIVVYKFFVIDCYNALIPNYLNSINCISIRQFDNYFNIILKSDPSNFKTKFFEVINDVLNQLKKLSNIDKNIINDKSYKNLIDTYSLYLEIINFGDTTNFLFNYFIPVFHKNSDDIIWRLI